MRYRDEIFTGCAAMLSSLFLAGLVNTDDYTHAAHAEARGYDALASQVSGSSLSPCWQAPRTVTK